MQMTSVEFKRCEESNWEWGVSFQGDSNTVILDASGLVVYGDNTVSKQVHEIRYNPSEFNMNLNINRGDVNYDNW